MNLTQLYILDAVASSESLLQAAVKLHKTQPALSMALKKLEQECGFTIVDRSQYRLQFTEAGKRFYQQAQQLLHQSAQLKSLAQHLSRGAEASLRLAFDEAVDLTPYMSAIRQAQQQYPHTELLLSCDYRLQALEKLKNQQVDLAISPWYPVFISLGDFEAVAIGSFDILCVASPEFLKQLSGPLTHQAQLAELPQLVANSEALNFDSGKLLPLQSARRVKVNNSLCMKQALLAHLGWGMVARQQVADELASGALMQLKPVEFPKFIQGEVHLVRHKDQLLGPVAKSIWQQLTEDVGGGLPPPVYTISRCNIDKNTALLIEGPGQASAPTRDATANNAAAPNTTGNKIRSGSLRLPDTNHHPFPVRQRLRQLIMTG